MTASEARELMENKPVADINGIYKDIKIRAKAGYDFDCIYHYKLSDVQIEELTSNGFIVEFKDQFYKIKW